MPLNAVEGGIPRADTTMAHVHDAQEDTLRGVLAHLTVMVARRAPTSTSRLKRLAQLKSFQSFQILGNVEVYVCPAGHM